MQRWCLFLALLGLSGAMWAQDSPRSSPSQSQPPSSPAAQNSSAGSTPGGTSPANSTTNSGDSAKQVPTTSMAPPRSDRVPADDLGPGESSSKESQVDLNPPVDDAQAHPQSSSAVAEAEAEALGGITEFHTWDPHKAAKSVEVGDFYFKRKNYRAAEDRYREALRYKDNDAVATIRLAVCLEKLGVLDDARTEYESYLKILPHGPQAAEAQKAIVRLKEETTGPKAQP